jgi:hypothetical protein
MWIKAKLALCKSRQTIMAFVEIYRLGGDHDPDGLRWVDHLRCIKRCAMSAIRLGVVFSVTRLCQEWYFGFGAEASHSQ